MANIRFFMLPEMGHLNAPTKLAKSLRKSGHHVRFFGASDIVYRRHLHSAGLEFIPVFERLHARRSEINVLMKFILWMIGRGEAMKVEWQNLLAQAVDATFARNEIGMAYRELDQLIESVKETRPDLFFVDY